MINLDKVNLVVDTDTKRVFLVEAGKKLDNGVLIAENKKNITDMFFDRIIRYCLAESENSKGIEFETRAGTLTFRKKEDEISND